MSTNNYITRKRKILIVEDDEINREILSAILDDTYEIAEAENGKVAYDILLKEYDSLSLILLDVYMPVMNGYEFLEKIKSDPLLSYVPVIVTTGSEKQKEEEKCLKLGASDFVTKPYNAEVVKARAASIIKLKESVNTLSMVEYDNITGFYTLPAFYHHVTDIIRSNPDKSFDICVANIKNFKLVNTLFGETKGDELLKYISLKYKEQIEEGIIARQGSMFYLFYDSSNRFPPEVGMKYYNDLIENSPVPSLTLKYGLYIDIDKSIPVVTLCDRAILASQSVSDNYHIAMGFYDKKMEDKLILNRELEDEFQSAIEKKEFKAYYQPKVDPNDDLIVAAEALVRWVKSDNKMISPGEFIPLFEKDGNIIALDEYMFRTVCEFLKKRILENKKVVPVSVNLSRNSIYKKDIASLYKKITDEYNVPSSLIPIEITESASITGEAVMKLADEFKRYGFSLHMDDFGSGYSSLSSLAKMPFDVLKIDKSLIDRIGTDKGNAVVKHSINIAQELGMEVVAEGVELTSQVEFLRNNGCDMIQGFYYYSPKNEEVFTSLLDSMKESELDIRNEYINIKPSMTAEYEMDENEFSSLEKFASEMMEGFLIYKATDNEEIIYANDELIHMFKCDSLEDFRSYTHNSFKGIVDKNDYEMVEKSIFSQINSETDNNDEVEYHINRKDGRKVFVQDRGHYRYTKSYGNIFYVFIKEK